MTGGDDALQAAAAEYASAIRECAAAEERANRAHRRLEASPDTLEYQIACAQARKREAAAALRKRRAEKTYLAAGGYVRKDPVDE